MQQLPAPDLNRLVAYFSHEYKPEETNKPPSKAYVQPFRVFTDYYREIYQSPLAKRDQVGPVWSTLSADQRKPFQDAAHVAKELYAKNLKAWETYCAKHGIQNKNRQGITTNQVKRLTQSIPNGKMCDPSALHAIARATELFIQRYAKDSFEYSDSQQSRKLSASDAYAVLESSPRYDFLRVILPDPDGESPQVPSPTATTIASSTNSTPTPTTTPNPLPPTPTTPTPQQMAAYQQRIAYYAQAAQAQAVAAQAAQMNRSHALPSASPMTKRRASSMPGSQSSMVRQSPRAVSASAVDGNRVTTTKRKFNEMDGGDQPNESRRKRQRMDDGKIQSSTNGDTSSMRFGHPQSLQGLGSTPSTMPPLRSSPYHSNDDAPSVRSASPSSEQQNDGGGGRQEDSKMSDTSHHAPTGPSQVTNGVTPQLKLNRSPGSQNGKFALQSAVQVPVQSAKGTAELKGMNALQSRQLLDYQAAYQQQQYMMAMNTYGYAGMDVMGFNSLGMITPQQQAYLSALAQHANPGTGVPQSTNETSDSQEWVKFMN